MASAPQAQGLPILYSDLVPLSSNEHADWKLGAMTSLDFIKTVHAFPVTVDEFMFAQRNYPIVFSSGADPVPLGLMGLNEGVNAFVDDAGVLAPGTYLPAYVRRFPFMLTRLRPDTEDLTLCFDPTPGLLGPAADGVALFEGTEPSQATKDALAFCEQFEMAAQKTSAFCKELVDLGLLEEGEVTINNPESPQPYIYRGFQMISEEKVRELRGDQLRKLNQSGALMLIYAQMTSLGLMSTIFDRQMQQDKVPAPV